MIRERIERALTLHWEGSHIGLQAAVDSIYAEVQSVEDNALQIRRLALQIDRAAINIMTGEKPS